MPRAKPAAYPFPFFGEGLAQYFEWAELHVWFAKAPPPAARKALARTLPRPLQGSVEWDGPVLTCGNGDQQANRAIREAYPPVGTSRWASDRQLAAFEADLNAWLVATHETQPILFAARREDGEAGGTALGAWHQWSMTQLPAHLARVLAAPKARGGRGWALAVPLQLALAHGAKAVKPAHRAWLEAWYERR